jgi:hypothetical protein
MPVSALIRSPIDSKCQSYGLKGCPELVDGAIAYAGGDKSLALQKLARARQLNTPAQLKQFAAALRAIGETVPPEAGKSLTEVAGLLSGEMSVSTEASTSALPANPYLGPGASPAAPAPTAPVARADEERRSGTDRLTLYTFALTARNDPMRLVSETVLVADAVGMECQIAGSPATCVRRRQGPVVVTDLVASEECGQRVSLVAADSDTPAFGFLWMLPARSSGAHGTTLSVGGGQWLFVAVKPPTKPQPTDRGCFVTWAGFQPRLVPGKELDLSP